MSIDVTKLAKVQAIKDLAERVQFRIDKLENGGTALKGASLVGNQLSFFTTTDTTTTPAYTFNLQTERFLDDDSTNFVPNFTFDSTTYLGATDPNLNGKPVMVLGLKTISNDGVTETLSYAFIDVSHLVDTYTASDTSIAIDGYKVKVNVSADSDNMLANTANGLYVDGSNKVDKVRTAVKDNFAVFDSDGGISDSGYCVADDADVIEMLNTILGKASAAAEVDSDTVTVTNGGEVTLNVTRRGNGAITISEDTALSGITYSVDGTSVTFTNSGATEGTGIYNLNVAATDNYESATIKVSVTATSA